MDPLPLSLSPSLPPSFPTRRCWFPCLDHASLLISYDVTVTVPSPKIQAAFNGKMLETNPIPDEDGVRWTRYRFATETLTAARAVGLAVGRFAAWDVPQSPRVKGLVPRAPSTGNKVGGWGGKRNQMNAGYKCTGSALNTLGQFAVAGLRA